MKAIRVSGLLIGLKTMAGHIKNNLTPNQEARIWAKENLTKQTATQHSIEITPELRAAVEKGQPLFKEAEAGIRDSPE